MLEAAAGADVVVMAAAVADFRPAEPGEHKMKRGETGPDLSLPLAQNPDILAELVERPRPGASAPSSSGSPPRPATRVGTC